MDNERERIINSLVGRILKKSPSEIIASDVELQKRIIEDSLKLIGHPDLLIITVDCSKCNSFRDTFNHISICTHNALLEEKRYMDSDEFDVMEFEYNDFSDAEDDDIFHQDFNHYLSTISKELGIKIVLVLFGFASAAWGEKDFEKIRNYTKNFVFVLSSSVSIKTLEENAKHAQFYSTNDFKTFNLT